MKRILILAACLLVLLSCGKEKTTVDIRELAGVITERGLAVADPGNYRGSVLYYGMAEYALASGDSLCLENVVDRLLAYGRGEVEISFWNNFINFECGGVGAYLLAFQGCDTLRAQVLENYARMWAEQPRSTENVMNAFHQQKNNRVFIDMLVSVTPANLYGGLLEGSQEKIDYAVDATLKLFDILRDQSTGLVHQARGWGDPEHISEDCWSRGNGWASVALMSLMKDLPADHPRRAEVEDLCASFFSSLVKFQDRKGLWHQEITDHSSYPEMSGTAFILSGLGTAVECGILPQKKYRKAFEKGLKGLFTYIDPDGSVGHTCRGCLHPGEGTKEDYKAVPYYYNEDHSFGPVMFALAQALRLGIESVEICGPLGSSNEGDREERPEK